MTEEPRLLTPAPLIAALVLALVPSALTLRGDLPGDILFYSFLFGPLSFLAVGAAFLWGTGPSEALPSFRRSVAETVAVLGVVLFAFLGFEAMRPAEAAAQPAAMLPFVGRVMSTVPLALLAATLLAVALSYPRPGLGFTNRPRTRDALVVLGVCAAELLLLFAVTGRPPFPLAADRFPRVLLFLAVQLLALVLPAVLVWQVFLQSRLETLLSPGWAIVAQAAVAASVGSIGYAVAWGGPAEFAIPIFGSIAAVGLLGGLLWHRTRNLYLCALFHLLAAPIGLL